MNSGGLEKSALIVFLRPIFGFRQNKYLAVEFLENFL
jgi:hypothetical protein